MTTVGDKNLQVLFWRLALGLCGCSRRGWGRWREVVELERRWGWGAHGRWRDVVGGGGVGARGGVVFTAAALDVARAAHLWGRETSAFLFLASQLFVIVLILVIRKTHLHNILALTPITEN